MRPKLLMLLALLALAVGVAACGGSNSSKKVSEAQKVAHNVANRPSGYIPHNNVEFNNYNKAQRLYDSPDTIIWCTTTWGNASAPIVTIPIAGKLTSSSVSLLPNTQVQVFSSDDYGTYTPEVRSVDGMYHGSPPPYRYGFTPGNQYVDFFNMPTLCTTALTSFQRQATKVSLQIDPSVAAAQRQAEAALRRGDNAAAQKALEGALGNGG